MGSFVPDVGENVSQRALKKSSFQQVALRMAVLTITMLLQAPRVQGWGLNHNNPQPTLDRLSSKWLLLRLEYKKSKDRNVRNRFGKPLLVLESQTGNQVYDRITTTTTTPPPPNNDSGNATQTTRSTATNRQNNGSGGLPGKKDVDMTDQSIGGGSGSNSPMMTPSNWNQEGNGREGISGEGFNGAIPTRTEPSGSSRSSSSSGTTENTTPPSGRGKNKNKNSKRKASNPSTSLSTSFLTPQGFFKTNPIEMYWRAELDNNPATSSSSSPDRSDFAGWTNNSSSSPSSLSSSLLTLQELEAYLQANGYVKQSTLAEPPVLRQQSPPKKSAATTSKLLPVPFQSPKINTQVGGRTTTTPTTTNQNQKEPKHGRTTVSGSSRKDRSSSNKVAFPQASVLSENKLKLGSTVAGAMLGIFLGFAILPNLWLMGGLSGALYGYDTSKRMPDGQPSSSNNNNKNNNTVANLVVSLGRQLTKMYLKAYDFIVGIWFMYKTGQLSYDYYQKYASLDQKFQIQDKVDAWNARFQEGKIAFDSWEQENEIGRKLLAGIRTIWLVEEQSWNKHKKQPKMRSLKRYDQALSRIKKIFGGLPKLLSGGYYEEWHAFLKGLRMGISEAQWNNAIRPRIGSALAAIIFVNITGALFTISPTFLVLLAVVLGGIVWPTWSDEWFDNMTNFWEETVDKGKENRRRDSGGGRENKRAELLPWYNPGSSVGRGGGGFFFPFFGSPKDNERFSFYERVNGSKRYYRTGPPNPWLQWGSLVSESNSKSRRGRRLRQQQQESRKRSFW